MQGQFSNKYNFNVQAIVAVIFMLFGILFYIVLSTYLGHINSPNAKLESALIFLPFGIAATLSIANAINLYRGKHLSWRQKIFPTGIFVACIAMLALRNAL